ncbi:MAG TPA: HAD-IB family hydrolase [Polyangiaceae bacterium]
MSRRAALFDLDRTLVRIDTARLYTRFRRDRGEASLRDALQVAWWGLQYTLGVIDAPRVALAALASFAGKEEQWLLKNCEEWFPQYVLPEIQARGREIVKGYREAGDLVAIVTAATVYAARPVAREIGIEHIVCSELELDQQRRFTGRVVEPLCYGQGKVTLAERLLAREGIAFENVTFYSDSITDLPLLSRVSVPIAVNPDRRLARTAKSKGWKIELW